MENIEKSNPIRKLSVPLHGFACGGGGSLQLERQIQKLKGVGKVYVNPATEEAYLDITDEFVVDDLLRLISKQGYTYETPRWN